MDMSANARVPGTDAAPLEVSAPLEIGFCVRDLESSLAFWRDALGLRFVSRLETGRDAAIASGLAPSAYVVVRLQLPGPGRERVKLFQLSGPADSAKPERPKSPPLQPYGFAFVTIIVGDLEAALAKLDAHGFPPRGVPTELRPGVFVALVDDPDGNVVELVQYRNLEGYRDDLRASR